MELEEVDDRLYAVVVNGEDQYSIWLADRDLPAGWNAVGIVGIKDDCLAEIEKLWTDMRPKSIRIRDEVEAGPTEG